MTRAKPGSFVRPCRPIHSPGDNGLEFEPEAMIPLIRRSKFAGLASNVYALPRKRPQHCDYELAQLFPRDRALILPNSNPDEVYSTTPPTFRDPYCSARSPVRLIA